MDFKSKNRKHYFEYEDYSNYQLIDYSVEAFEYFDKNGINFQFIIGGIMGDIITDYKKVGFRSQLDSLFSDINVITDFKSKDLDKELTNFKKLSPGYTDNVKLDFFLDLYKNSKEYSGLFRFLGEFTGWISQYNGKKMVGLGVFRGRMENQLNYYATAYLKIHLGYPIKLDKNLGTILNDNKSPILYGSGWGSLHVCKKDMSHVSFYIRDRGEEAKIRTFENIQSIGDLNIRDNVSVVNLGTIERIIDYCSIRNTKIENLGDLKSVGGSMSIENCPNLNDLGHLERIGGNLNLRGCHINKVENLKIKGNLLLNKKFKENHYINNCEIIGKVKFFSPMVRDY